MGLGAALEYMERIGRANIARYEQELLGYATQALTPVPGLRMIGTAPEKAGVLSFVLDGFRPERWERRSTQRGSRYAPAITARSRSCGDSG